MKTSVRSKLKAGLILSAVIVPSSGHPNSGLVYPQKPDCGLIVESYEANHHPLISSNPTRNNHSPTYVYREFQNPFRWDCEIRDYYKFDTLTGATAQILPRINELSQAQNFFNETLVTRLVEAMRVECDPTGYAVQSFAETSFEAGGAGAVTFIHTRLCGKYPWRDYVNN
jgi:hypothetical protein